jgi:hypothetical protein
MIQPGKKRPRTLGIPSMIGSIQWLRPWINLHFRKTNRAQLINREGVHLA